MRLPAERPSRAGERVKTVNSKSAKLPRERAHPPTALSEPVDVVDGIPDRSRRRGGWVLMLLAAIFLAWMAFLIAVKILGSA